MIYYYYDADGQPTYTISGGGVQTNYSFDFDGQLVSLTKPGSTTTFTYDALGRQFSRTVNGAYAHYYYDGGQMLFETGASGETAQYTWGNGLIRRNGEYALTDGRGSVRLETTAGQSVTATSLTDASGLPVASSGSSASPYGFQGDAGYRADGDGPAGLSGFQKVGARYYDPLFGRFITRDTDLSQSPYAYCDGDPVNFSDPSGHKKKPPKPTQPTSGGGAPSSGGSGSSGPSGGSSGGTSTGGNSGGTSGGTPTQGGKIPGTDTQKLIATTAAGMVATGVRQKTGSIWLGGLAGAGTYLGVLWVEQHYQEGVPQNPMQALPYNGQDGSVNY